MEDLKEKLHKEKLDALEALKDRLIEVWVFFLVLNAFR